MTYLKPVFEDSLAIDLKSTRNTASFCTWFHATATKLAWLEAYPRSQSQSSFLWGSQLCKEKCSSFFSEATLNGWEIPFKCNVLILCRCKPWHRPTALMAKESGLRREAHLCSSAKRRTRKLSIRNQSPQRKSTCTLAAHQAWRALAVLTETSTSPGTPQDSSACPDEDAQPAGDSGRGADACSLGLGLREGSRKPGKEQPGNAAPQPGARSRDAVLPSRGRRCAGARSSTSR